MEKPVFKKDVLIMILVGALIIVPAAAALAAYAITKNPSFRPLSITFESLTAAGLLEETSDIVAVISTGQHSKLNAITEVQTAALKAAFQRYGTDVKVKFRTVPGGRDTSITYLVGENRIGPYPLSKAAAGIAPATQAERLVKAQRAAAAQRLAERKASNRSFFTWFRVFQE
jgi:hypothetical protein